MTTIRLSTMAAALFVAAAAVVPSSAAGIEEECNQRMKCAKHENSDPVRLAECKDDCALEADYSVAMGGLSECDDACKAKGGSEGQVGKCMEPCTTKVDVTAAVLATRSCYRKCAVNPAGVQGCQARCEATADKALDACFKKCAAEAGTDVARVFACNVACPFDAVASQVWLT